MCVEQTAAELCARGYKVHIVADACTSRSQEERLLAFEVLQYKIIFKEVWEPKMKLNKVLFTANAADGLFHHYS